MATSPTDRPLGPTRLPPPADPPTGAAATSERLLQAAHELLHERGGGAVSVSDLCTRAGANVAMVKYCFGSKDGLYDALVERVVRSFQADLAQLDELALPPRETMERHVGGIARNFLRFPYLSSLLNERLRRADPETVARLSEAFALPTRAWHARLLESGAAAGAFRQVDPTFFFFSVIGICEFLFSARSWLEQTFDERLSGDLVERFVAHTTRMVLDGIGPERPDVLGSR